MKQVGETNSNIKCNIISAVGTCMPLYGKKYGESCVRNSDCETGFVCLEAEGGRMMCAEQAPGVGRFGEFFCSVVFRSFSDLQFEKI